MASLAHSPTNDDRLSKLEADIRELGRSAAQGKDSLPMLAVKIAYAATDGVISLDKDADGNDDAQRLYTEYVKAESKKAVHEHTAGGLKANVSKLRQIITASVMPTCDFQATLNAVVLKREEMLGVKDGPKVKPAYAAYVDAARLQISQPDDLTADQIEEVIRKPDPNEKTVEGELKRVEKILGDLIEGKGGVKCDDAEIVEAHDRVTTKLAALMLTKDLADTIAKAQALGLQIVQPAPSAEVTPEVTPEVIDEAAEELAAEVAMSAEMAA